jgi:hypothetical protein
MPREERIVFTCANCGAQEALDTDEMAALVRMRRPELFAGTTSSQREPTRGHVDFAVHRNEDGKDIYTVRRRLGVETKGT